MKLSRTMAWFSVRMRACGRDRIKVCELSLFKLKHEVTGFLHMQSWVDLDRLAARIS